MATPLSTTDTWEFSSVESADFRAACSSFVTGVTVVTARSADGAHGSTVNSFTSLSVTPPQIVVCLAKTSSTLDHLLASGAFTVNILADDQDAVARLFASKRPNKLAAVGWAVGANGAPSLEGIMGALECSVVEAQDQATHVLVIGRVTRTVQKPGTAPLVFFRSVLTSGGSLEGSSA